MIADLEAEDTHAVQDNRRPRAVEVDHTAETAVVTLKPRGGFRSLVVL